MVENMVWQKKILVVNEWRLTSYPCNFLSISYSFSLSRWQVKVYFRKIWMTYIFKFALDYVVFSFFIKIHLCELILVYLNIHHKSIIFICFSSTLSLLPFFISRISTFLFSIFLPLFCSLKFLFWVFDIRISCNT